MEAYTARAGRDTRWQGESGMTLVELMLVMVLALIISAAALMVLSSLQRQAAADIERSAAVQDAEAGLQKMTREIREAYAVTLRSGDEMSVMVRRNGVDSAVRYSCDEAHPTRAGLYQCVRITTVAGVERREVTVDRIINAAPATAASDRVFQFPNGRPSYVRAQVKVPARGEKSVAGFAYQVVLDDGFYMRNCDATC